jgi:CheY-like chemotaxis protein
MARIAIADDSTPIRLLLRRKLEGAGHEVVEAADGAELVDLLDSLVEDKVDLALVDWMMPRLDGEGTTAVIRERWPDMPVVGFTAGWSAADYEVPKRTDDFVGKPFDFDYLFETIDELTGGLPRP